MRFQLNAKICGLKRIQTHEPNDMTVLENILENVQRIVVLQNSTDTSFHKSLDRQNIKVPKTYINRQCCNTKYTTDV